VEKHQQARQAFRKIVEREFAEANKEGCPLCLIFADIDQFRQINEAYGHDGGDQVLAEMSQLLQSQVRDKDIFARWGGEEFIVLTPDTTLSDAQEIAEHMRKAVKEHRFPQAGQVTISLGIAAYRAGDTPADLIGRTDRATHRAKERGRNRVELE
jgi:diguanylate cyclase (GGDEF)-like protein